MWLRTVFSDSRSATAISALSSPPAIRLEHLALACGEPGQPPLDTCQPPLDTCRLGPLGGRRVKRPHLLPKALPGRLVRVIAHFYPAGHGFNCDQRGSYHAESSALARTRTLEFLAKHIG
jgi:hypothetical protein